MGVAEQVGKVVAEVVLEEEECLSVVEATEEEGVRVDYMVGALAVVWDGVWGVVLEPRLVGRVFLL